MDERSQEHVLGRIISMRKTIQLNTDEIKIKYRRPYTDYYIKVVLINFKNTYLRSTFLTFS